MADLQRRVFIFGDDCRDISKELSQLLQVKDDAILTAFFERAFQTIRSQIGSLSPSARNHFPHFTSLAELNRLHVCKSLHPALRQSLLCTQQIGSFIRLNTQFDNCFPDPLGSYVIGLGLGAIPASAISTCKDLLQLVPVAVDLVKLTFHLGLFAADVATSVEHSATPWSTPWSASIASLSADACNSLLSRLNATVPKISAAYVARVASNSIDISGPPSILTKLGSEVELKSSGSCSVPYHAQHLYRTVDVQSLLASHVPENQTSCFRRTPYMSGSTANELWPMTLRSLLEEALSDILLRQVRVDKIINNVSQFLLDHKTAKVTIFAFAARSTVLSLPPKISSLGTVIWESQVVNDGLNMAPSKGPNDTFTPISRSKIAIVGMSGRFPDANNTEEFWNLLAEGRDVHKPVPPTRWDGSTHVDPTGKRKNTSATPFGCWLDDAGLFDAKFFHLSPREAPQCDPAQRIALLTAYEALEQAGMVPGATPSTKKDRVGVFYGVTSNDWMETNSAQNIDTYMIPGGNRAFIPGRVNYFFKFSGPSYSIDTACSSSLAAIHAACNSLWRGDIDTAIVGGTNILTNPDFHAGLDRGHFLSRTGGCKTFDDSADGYCRGEAVCTLILKRENDAIADRDPIQALLLSAHTNHSADAESITRPHGGAQKAIFHKLLNDAGVEPQDVSYIECHGTGTQAGDAEEMRSVLETFAPATPECMRTNSMKLYLGSAKANIGHGEAASGVSSIAKVLLMMKNDQIPPHCGIKTKINHKFPNDLRERKVHIADQLVSWPRPSSGTRRVFINNFSAAGGNSAILLEDAPPVYSDNGRDAREMHCIAVSAKCSKSLLGNIDSMLSFLDTASSDDLLLPRLSYTTTARRLHHPHRVIVHGRSIQDVRKELMAAKQAKIGFTRPSHKPQVAFAFTGQGSQYADMGKTYFHHFSVFRSKIAMLDQIAQRHGYPSFISTISGNESTESLSPVVFQLALVALEIALARLWMSWGIQPKCVMGHSLGEYAALNIAGVLSESDTIYLVGKRAQLLVENCTPGTHSMLAVHSTPDIISNTIRGTNCDIACINSANDVVLAGTKSDIDQVQKRFQGLQAKSTVLKTPFAFHSSQVEPILESFRQAASGVTFHAPAIPVVCPTESRVVSQSGVFGAPYLAKHCRHRVDMHGAVTVAMADGLLEQKTTIMEMGPQPIVSKMIQAIISPAVATLATVQQSQSSWTVITQTLGTLYMKGLDINWIEYHQDFKSSQVVLNLPAYSWDLTNYWMQYVNDWSLRKGEPANSPPIIAPLQSKQTEAKLHKPVSATLPVKNLESTTIHRVVQNTITGDKGTIIIESDLLRADLNPLVKGHCVNGVPLATPSIYAEIALSLGNYVRDQLPSKADLLVSIRNMVIEKALIAQNSGPQILRATFELQGLAKGATCRFETINENAKRPARHSQCSVNFDDRKSAFEKAQNKAVTISKRMSSLQEDLVNGKAYRFNRAMIYKMVGTLAQFDPNYMGLREIVLNSGELEASGSVSFEAVKIDGNFHTHPAFIDALSQISGFVMNANDGSNLEEEVFINHGWGGLQLFQPLHREKTYQVHTKMCETPGRKWMGDLLITCSGQPIACFTEIVLQGVGKRALHFILQRESELGRPKATASSNPVATRPPPKEAKPLAGIEKALVPQVSITAQSLVVESNAIPSKIVELNATVTVPAVAPVSAAPVESALQIISEESGIAIEELKESDDFSNIGIDSLLGLIIAERFREELELDIDSTSLFTSVSNIKGLKGYLSNADTTSSGETLKQDPPLMLASKDPSLEPISAPPNPQVTAWADRENTVMVSIGANETPSDTSEASLGLSMPLKSDSLGQLEKSGVFVDALGIISEETGIDVEDLTDDTNFLDVGLDSLLSLIVTGRVREELNVDFPSDISLFSRFPSIKDLRTYFDQNHGAGHDPFSGAPSSISSMSDDNSDALHGGSGLNTPPLTSHVSFENVTLNATQLSSDPSLSFTYPSAPSRRPDIQKPAVIVPPASSIVLQGRPRTDKSTLILLPDGSGSASSYASLPRLHPSVAVIGLNCPFMRNPGPMEDCKLPDLLASYLAEIRRRQTQGPYNLGGWSSGGILAFAVAQQLIREGEEVERLLLIDSPLARGLDRLPQRWFDFTSGIDFFGRNMPNAERKPTARASAPEWLVPHFKATIEVLHDYFAEPMPFGFTPKTTIVWATECVLDGVNFPKLPPGPDDTEGMKFLTEKRTDFTSSGWDMLLPGEAIQVESIPGAHHFSMMSEFAPTLASILGKAMMEQ